MPNSSDNQNDDAIITSGQPVSGVVDDDPEFATMTDREKALVQKARGVEKKKLYKRQSELQTQITELQAQLRQLQQQPPPATPAQANAQNDQIGQLIESVQNLAKAQAATNERIEAIQNGEVQRRRESELRQYALERSADFRRTHPQEDLIDGFVGGDTEEEIDDSIKIANAEWKLAIQKHEARRAPAAGPASVTVQGNGRRPAGTPPVQVANSVEADDHANIDELTSDDAVRDGSYAKHRNELLGKLKRGYRYSGNTQQG